MSADVSVVIPVRDRREYVVQAIDSVLSQDLQPREIVVVDDGSTDGTVEAIGACRGPIRLIEQEPEGRSAARNNGISRAKGRLIAFLDSDDLWLPGKLRRQVKLLDELQGDAVCTGYVRVISTEGTPNPYMTSRLQRDLDGTRRRNFALPRVVIRPGIYTSSLLLSKSTLEEIGGFDESLDALEDWDLLIRLARTERFASVSWPPIVGYRMHPGNTDANSMAIHTVKVVDKQIDRTSEPSSRSSLYLMRASARRSIAQQSAARHDIWRAFRADPGVAIRNGGLRLLVGSYVPSSLLEKVRKVRARSTG